MRPASSEWARRRLAAVIVAGVSLAACNLGAADPTEPAEGAPETTADPTGTTQATIDAPETEVTLAPPGAAPTPDYLVMREHLTQKGTFPVMVEASGGFVSAEPGSANAQELADTKEILELGALAIAYESWRLSEEPGTPCPAHRLRVSWEGPDDVFAPDADVQYLSYIPPLGPPRTGEDRAAGIVYCKGSDYAFMGFEAFWESEPGVWAMYPIPQG